MCETIWRKFCGAMVFTLNPMKETIHRGMFMFTFSVLSVVPQQASAMKQRVNVNEKYGKKFGVFTKTNYLCTHILDKEWAFSSAGLEHLPYKQRVGGSNPSTPTPRVLLF